MAYEMIDEPSENTYTKDIIILLKFQTRSAIWQTKELVENIITKDKKSPFSLHVLP